MTVTRVTTGSENGHEWVDLGLSVKWATCNVGATKPEGYGGYFSWGEVTEKNAYYWDTYKWGTGPNSLTKYTQSSNTLDLSDDAAHQNWGGSWRMPTRDELNELRLQCTWTGKTVNGVHGFLITGKNGNTIFLPISGRMIGNSVKDSGAKGTAYYWSSSANAKEAVALYFNSGNKGFLEYARMYGQSIRPVIK